MPPQVGQVINNKYRLLRHIGDGGMGSVYEARHETLGTTVALKFLHLEFSRREGLVQRFLQEARASARIQSPHVVRVADVEKSAEGDVFIVMEYLEGKTLQALYEELYRAGRRLSYQEALDYAAQMLDGVEAAHAAGIVHRDLKPDNVMITLDAKGATLLKLLDFGIAKLKAIGGAPGLTRPGVMMGTPEYMAPEQASSADTVDVRADIFSLGVIIFEMLGGQRPVGGDDPHELAAAYRNGQISQLVDLVPAMAPELAAAVHRAMAAEPGARFATAAAMRAAIEPFAAAVRPPSPSRLRAGGTIGVSVSAHESSSSAVGALPRMPPPPTPALEGALRAPSGVAKTWPPDEGPDLGGGSAAPVPSAPAAARASGTVVDVAAHGDRTHRMDEPYTPIGVLTAGGGKGGGPPPGRRRRRSGSSVAWVLLVAAGVTGLVLGVVYLASRPSSAKDDPPRATTAPPVVTADPLPPPQPANPPPFVPPLPGPPPSPRQGPAGPRSRPAPAPSGLPSATPTAPPALIIPTAFPFPNPFQPAPPAPPGSGSPPKQEPPPLFSLP